VNKTLSRFDAVLLIGAPVLLVIGGLLLVRYDDQGWNEVLDAMSARPDRSNGGWLLMLAGTALIVPPTVALASLVRQHRPRLGAVALLLTMFGWASVPAYAMGAIVMEAMSHAPDRAAQVSVLRFFNDGASGFVFLAGVAGAIGYIVLAVALARTHLVPLPAAILTGSGGAGTMLVMAGPVRWLLLLATVLLLAGHTWSVVGNRGAVPAAHQGVAV
jgi:hypothetical protein